MIPCKSSWTALLSEGGHVTFSPASPTEVAILEYAWKAFDHVSAERALSGPGLVNLYEATAAVHGQAVHVLAAAGAAVALRSHLPRAAMLPEG